MVSGHPTIFVSIPSYRDPECQYTVLDLFRKAKHPERIFIGVCWQVDREVDTNCFRLDLGEFEPRIRTIFLHHSEARGPCYARALIQQKLFQGEDFTLQLDSHYRMIESWDEELLTQLERCPGDKPILTTYPSSYTLPDDYAPGGPDLARVHPNQDPIVLCAREFGAVDGFLRITGKTCHSERVLGAPVRGFFWAAGFAFSASVVIQEVPYDPSLTDLFFGEEPSMAVRLFTSGWDFFAPTKVIGYHLWTRKHRPIFREHACPEQKQREMSSQTRVRRLLHQELGGDDDVGEATYGLGKQRTLDAYQAMCGVNFSEKYISDSARRGGLSPDMFVNGDPVRAGVLPDKAADTLAALLGGAAKPSPLPASAAVHDVPMLGVMPDKVTDTLAALLGGSAGASGASDDPLGGNAVAALLGGAAGGVSKPAISPPRQLQLSCEVPGSLRILRPEDIEVFNRRGILILDGFLRDRCYASAAPELAAQAAHIALEGVLRVPLRPAKLGRGDRQWSSTAVRGDEMTWLSMPSGVGLSERARKRVLRGKAAIRQAAPWQAPGPAEESEFDVIASSLRAEFTGAGSATPSAAAGDPRDFSEVDEVNKQQSAADAPFYEDLDVHLAKLAELRDELDSACGFGSQRLSVMLAKYPGGGARYARHRDALPEHVAAGGHRRLTLVYYLNSSWKTADGGQLRAHLPECIGSDVPGAERAEGTDWTLDVEPLMDRLVIFSSEWLEHEVLPAHAERYAITGWIY